MEGEASPPQIAAFLAALRTKGETADEITGMVESMRNHATEVHRVQAEDAFRGTLRAR